MFGTTLYMEPDQCLILSDSLFDLLPAILELGSEGVAPRGLGLVVIGLEVSLVRLEPGGLRQTVH